MSEHPEQMPRRTFPCGPCPARADNGDNPAAKFPPERWLEMSATVRDPLTGQEPQLGAILFGCHKGDPATNEDLACAGWLASFGGDHLAIRLAKAEGRLPASALRPGENWPPLYATWEEMVRAQTRYDPAETLRADPVIPKEQ